MGFSDGVSRSSSFKLEEVYDPLLSLSGLTKQQIRGLDLPGLQEALVRVNDAIANPDQFPKIDLEARAGRVVGVLADSTVSATMGVLPLLLQRKRLILERISELRSQERIGGLRELIDRLPDDEAKQALGERLDALEGAASEAEHQARDAANEQSKLQFQRERELALLKVQLSERRWKLRSAQLARESVTPMIGATLLVGLAVTLIVAMFAKVEVSALVSNSFLIVLGYFFGQSTEARQGRSIDEPRREDL
ncbi:hypothetical protein [Streptomyces sp. CAI 127]|uniref:hypothetical protein n=1 Tax=Streptomyces sp. CAI 127 TaxID=1076397 RepID=UPI001587A0E8|nr:hypothetical protein [Streptomyces sp. CAI 127]NUW02349.1 hypothetical protein [Streptomyces sp. CAI 127]